MKMSLEKGPFWKEMSSSNHQFSEDMFVFQGGTVTYKLTDTVSPQTIQVIIPRSFNQIFPRPGATTNQRPRYPDAKVFTGQASHLQGSKLLPLNGQW